MRLCLTGIVLAFMAACGGGSGVSNMPVPASPPVPTPSLPATPNPVTSSFFSDASAALPASRGNDCFDAHAVDIDTDGDLDLVLAGFGQNGAPNLVYLNDGSATFTDASATLLPANMNISRHTVSGDLDMDGDPDVIFANVRNNNSNHEYYLNTGAGGVLETSPQALPVNGRSSFVAARDFDNDNDLDLFIANFGASEFLTNDGFGIYSNESATRMPGNDGQITEDSGIGDVNGDGFVDIMLAYRGSNAQGEGRRNLLWMNDGLGVFSDVTSTNMPANVNSTFDIQLVDIDGDGDLDALVGNATIGNTNVPLLDNLYTNDGNGIFTDETSARWPQATLSNTYGISTVDLDHDGDLDILTAENIGITGDGLVRAYANDGSGFFSEQTTRLLGAVIGNIVDIEVADLNGDGVLDLYFCSARNFGSVDSARDFLLLGQ